MSLFCLGQYFPSRHRRRGRRVSGCFLSFLSLFDRWAGEEVSNFFFFFSWSTCLAPVPSPLKHPPDIYVCTPEIGYRSPPPLPLRCVKKKGWGGRRVFDFYDPQEGGKVAGAKSGEGKGVKHCYRKKRKTS